MTRLILRQVFFSVEKETLLYVHIDLQMHTDLKY